MKNKFFICFRPVCIETDEKINYKKNSKLFCSLNERNSKKSKFRSSSFSDKENRKIGRSSSEVWSSSRKFCHDSKSILVEASVQKQAKSICDPNANALILRSTSSIPKQTPPEFKETRSNSTASFTSCPRSVSERKPHQIPYPDKSISRSKSLSLLKLLEREKQSISGGKRRSTCSCTNAGLVVLVMSLFVTVFWGRVCAILSTTILLYFLHGRSFVDRRTERKMRWTETEREYKKRVIMDGLLQRSHHNYSLCH